MPGSVLVLGFGNPGRLDDGLGPAVVDAIEGLGLADVTCDADYQLRLEDAAEIARHDAVVFVDAAATGPAPFSFERVRPEPGRRFTTHSVPPGALVEIARACFGREVPAWLLAVRGHTFDDFGEGLSDAARIHRDEAVAFLIEALQSHRTDGAAALDRFATPKGVTHA